MSEQKTILIIEDNPMNMELATDLLEAAGFIVVQAENANLGIFLAKTRVPDLILMDINLPDIDGLSTTMFIKSSNEAKHIPVVAVTAYAMTNDEETAREFGCVGYVTKPINTRTFVDTIKLFLPGEDEAKAA